jgi:small-conductance mechanosensitive channel
LGISLTAVLASAGLVGLALALAARETIANGDSALEFELLCWAYQPDLKGKQIHQLNCDIYKSSNAAAIIIPFPQLDLSSDQDLGDRAGLG